jgi:hypothetical protein
MHRLGRFPSGGMQPGSPEVSPPVPRPYSAAHPPGRFHPSPVFRCMSRVFRRPASVFRRVFPAGKGPNARA